MKFVIVLLYCASCAEAVLYLSDDQYKQMPPIVSLDPYHSCLRDNGSLYCTAYIAFVADKTSSLLTMMQEYSKYTSTRYNHTKSLYGVCVTDQCKEFYKHGETSDQKQILEACLNRSISQQYNLKVIVEDGFSCTGLEKRFEIETADWWVAGVVLALLLLNGIGSFFDIYCVNLHGYSVAKLLLSFSIPRHWKRLISPPSDDPRAKPLRGIDGIRSLMSMTVILIHSMVLGIIFPADTMYVENDIYNFTTLRILLNGNLFMQIFHFISAMLLVYSMNFYREEHYIGWELVPKLISKRWLRITPSYALVFAICATWSKFFSSGPIWDIMVTDESNQCRRYWWMYFVYINNYVEDTICMLQSWSLAADIQLFCIGVITFVLCQKTNQTKLILSTMLIIAILIPPLHVYFQCLDGNYIFSPPTVFKFLVKDRTFSIIYRRGHTNLAGYVLGIIAGHILYHLHTNPVNISKFKILRPLYWCAFPVAFLVLSTGKVLYDEEPPSLYHNVLLAAFMGPTITFIAATFIIGMIIKINENSLLDRIFEWKGWIIPARLSYSAYLVHVPILRIVYGTITEPLSYTLDFYICNIFVVAASFLVAAVLWLTVEKPVAQVIKCCVSSGAKDQRKRGQVEQQKDKKKTY